MHPSHDHLPHDHHQRGAAPQPGPTATDPVCGMTVAPIQRLADLVSSWFVPAVVLVATLTAIRWGFFGPEPRFSYALVNAVSVLIIACPCALGSVSVIANALRLRRIKL